MYLSGYAVECAFIALICYAECNNNFKDTSAFVSNGITGSTMHQLSRLLSVSPSIQTAISADMTQKLRTAWSIVASQWKYCQLRYYNKDGNKDDAERFVDAVRTLHALLLRQQGEI